jgi:hypothetical protein
MYKRLSLILFCVICFQNIYGQIQEVKREKVLVRHNHKENQYN